MVEHETWAKLRSLNLAGPAGNNIWIRPVQIDMAV